MLATRVTHESFKACRSENFARKQSLALVRNPSVAKRTFKYAIVVVAILTTIHHGDAILRGDLSAARLFRMELAVLVPHGVATLSSVGTMREARWSEPVDLPWPCNQIHLEFVLYTEACGLVEHRITRRRARNRCCKRVSDSHCH